MFKSSYRLGLQARLFVLLTKVKAIKDKNTGNVEILESLQFLFNTIPQGKWETAERYQKRLASRRLVKALGEVVGRIDTQDSSFESRERERLATASSPFIQDTDCPTKKTYIVSLRLAAKDKRSRG